MKELISNLLLKILIDDCESSVVIGGDLSISYDEIDRMNQALMKLRHPNLAIDELQNRWTRDFVKRVDDVRQLDSLMKSMGYR